MSCSYSYRVPHNLYQHYQGARLQSEEEATLYFRSKINVWVDNVSLKRMKPLTSIEAKESNYKGKRVLEYDGGIKFMPGVHTVSYRTYFHHRNHDKYYCTTLHCPVHQYEGGKEYVIKYHWKTVGWGDKYEKKRLECKILRISR